MRKYIITGLILLAGFPAFALLPETADYTNRCGVALDAGYVAAVDRFIQAGKDSGWWNKLIAVNFFCAPNQTAALVNARTNTFGLKNVNGVTHTPYEGFQGDGTSSYLEMSNTPSSLASAGFTTTSHSVFVFSQTDNRSVAAEAGSIGPGTVAIGVQACSTNDLTRIWAGTNRVVGALWITNTPATAKGLTGVVRSSAAGGFAVRNDGFMTFSELSAIDLPTSAFRYFRLGTQTSYSSNQLSLGLIGNGTISAEQVEDLYRRCAELLCDLGSWTELDSSLSNYLDRVTGSETWSGQFIFAADRFIKRGKANGNWWNKMKAVYFFCAPSSNGAVVNAKETNYNLTVNGGVTFGITGAKGNGTNGYLDTGATISGLGLSTTGHSMFVYCQSDEPSYAGEIGAMGPNTRIIGVRAHCTSLAWIWSGMNGGTSFAVDSAFGLTGFVRNSTTGGFRVKDESTATFAMQITNEPTSNVRFFRLGISTNYSKNRLAFGFIGDSRVTTNDAADIYNASKEMLRAVPGAWVEPELPETVAPPHAFSRGSLTNVTPYRMNIFRFASPPASNGLDFVGIAPYTNASQKGYAHGPISDAITRPWIGATWSSSDTNVGRWELLWSNRKMDQWCTKANIGIVGIYNSTNGQACRTEYTTYSNAVGATLVTAAYTVGMKFRGDPDYGGKGWADIATNWGYDISAWQTLWDSNTNHPAFTNCSASYNTGTNIVHYSYADTNANTFFPYTSSFGYMTCRDKIILQPKRTCDLKPASMVRGIMLDHEHSDDRPADLELRSIIELRKIVTCKGYKLAAFGEGTTSVPGQHSGWTTTNAWQVLTNLDWFVIEVKARGGDTNVVQQEMQDQYNYFKGPDGDKSVPTNRLCMQIAVGDEGMEMTTNEVITARNFMVSKGITNVFFPTMYVTWGGNISRTCNQNLANFLGLPTQ